MTTTTFTSQKKHHSFLTLIIFLITFVGAVFYVKPLWDEETALSAVYQQKQEQKTQLSQQVQTLKDLQQKLQTGSEVEKLTTLDSIPEKFEQGKLIADLKDLAQQNQVVLKGMNFNLPANNTERVKKAGVNVNLTGSEEGLLNFLKGIETNHRKIVVKLINVQYGKSDNGTVRLNFNLNMETYYQNTI